MTHGGLFKDDQVRLEDIRKVDRDRQPPEEGEIKHCCSGLHAVHTVLTCVGIMCDLLWSDPQVLVSHIKVV